MPASPSSGGRYWLDERRLRVYPRLFLFMYVVAALGWVLASRDGIAPMDDQPLGYDFITFYAASKMALEGDPVAAYDNATIHDVERGIVPGAHIDTPWLYPPTFLLVVLPLALMPYFVAYGVFIFGTLIGYLAAVKRAFVSPYTLPWTLAFPGLFINLMHGQNAFLTASLAGGALLNLRTRPILAGVLVGLLTIKPHLGLLFPIVLICGRHWRALIAAGVTAAAFLGASVAVFGTGTLHAFFETLPLASQYVTTGALPLPKSPTFFSFARLLDLPPAAAWALYGATAAFTAGAVAWTWLRPCDDALKFAIFVVGSLIATPYLWSYDLAWLALSMAWFVGYAARNGWRRGERALLVALWLLPSILIGIAMHTKLQIAPFLVMALFLMILRRVRDDVPRGALVTDPA